MRPSKSSDRKSGKRTKTKFEQNLSTSGKDEKLEKKEEQQQQSRKPCKFKAQVLFESDTDSMATSSESKSSSRRRKQKELVSETKFYQTSRLDQVEEEEKPAKVSAQAGKGSADLRAILYPKWDYTLKVNRMRGNRVDSRVK